MGRRTPADELRLWQRVPPWLMVRPNGLTLPQRVRAEILNMFDTVFSPCRKYRYTLWREWSYGNGYAMFIGLNPSTADETKDDPTVRRCIDFAQRWGYQALCMTNLFAYRSTNPRGMRYVIDPVGPDNDKYLVEYAEQAGIIIAAWGTYGGFMGRGVKVLKMIPNLYCLKKTSAGFPAHPLYLKKDWVPVKY